MSDIKAEHSIEPDRVRRDYTCLWNKIFGQNFGLYMDGLLYLMQLTFGTVDLS